jgi:hypothetical protein
VPSKDGHEGNPIPVGIGFLGIQYTNHGLAWDRLGHGITKVVSEAPAVADIIRSFAAKAHTFRFPLEIQDEDTNAVRIPAGEGEAAIQHVETVFPQRINKRSGRTESRSTKQRSRRNRNRSNAKSNEAEQKENKIRVERTKRKAKETPETNKKKKRKI